MIDFKDRYDICIASFSDINHDARTANLIEACVKLNLQVLVISLHSDKLKNDNKNYENITIPAPKNKRMFLKLICFLKKSKKILKQYNFNIFWASDFYSLLLAKYFKNKKIIYDSREIYSALSTLHNSHIKQMVIKFIEEKLLKYVHNVVVSGELDAIYLKKTYNLKIPIDIIYNYPNFQPLIKSNLIRERFNIPKDKIILIYQGMLLDGRGIVPIFNAILNSNNFIFIILGDGSYKNTLINIANSLNISNKVFFAGNIDYSELHKWTSSADIGICNIEPISFSYELALPNKLFEYIRAGLPVLATDLPALKNIIESYDCGIAIPRENKVEDILNALQEIVQNYSYFSKNVCNISHNFCYEKQIDIIKRIIIN